jgi:CheY-like chemotaxis protein
MERRPSKPAVILLVEDDPGDQELTRRAIAGDVFRAELRIVSDGEEALDYLWRRGRYADAHDAPCPDLVLLDLNMPKLDGREVLKRLKADARLRQIPVVVLTTSRQELDILRSYDLGCNSFITKPVDVDAFIAALRELGSYWFELVTLPEHAPVGG